jgi:hypothetical protein
LQSHSLSNLIASALQSHRVRSPIASRSHRIAFALQSHCVRFPIVSHLLSNRIAFAFQLHRNIRLSPTDLNHCRCVGLTSHRTLTYSSTSIRRAGSASSLSPRSVADITSLTSRARSLASINVWCVDSQGPLWMRNARDANP